MSFLPNPFPPSNRNRTQNKPQDRKTLRHSSIYVRTIVDLHFLLTNVRTGTALAALAGTVHVHELHVALFGLEDFNKELAGG